MSNINKKVLLREHKRHTARHVASARYAALSAYREGEGVVPHPVLDGGGDVPHPVLYGGCTPSQGTPHLDLGCGAPINWMGYPLPGPGMGYLTLAGWGTPLPGPGMGYPLPHQLDGVPPTWTWNWVPLHVWTWDGVPPGWMGYPLSGPGMGYPFNGWMGYPPDMWTDRHL